MNFIYKKKFSKEKLNEVNAEYLLMRSDGYTYVNAFELLYRKKANII